MSTSAQQSSSSSSNTMNINKMMELNELQSWENKIKEKIKAMWKAGYSYVIICEFATNALGIQRTSEAMKAIAKVQSILDKVNGDLNELKKLLEELQGMGFPAYNKWYYKNKNGVWKQGNQNFDPSGKEPKYKPKDWGKKGSRWATPTEQMGFAIKAWLAKDNDLGIKGPDGKTLNNEQAMRYIWKELYGPKCDNKGGLISQLKAALNNPWYNQSKSNGAYKTLKDLNSNRMFGSDKKDWTDSNGQTFLDFLRGDGNMSYQTMTAILEKAVTNSWYKNNNVTPPKGIKSKDDIGNITSGMDSVVQSSTAMNSTESADLSMFAQQLTSLINVVQQMLQQNDKSNTTMVNNQQAR
ncbi:MAG: hypothetical protein K1060chlam4_00427 [Candidatus Anoxychlamydiales bacterium]|nr:hypothetical protein [Candidatus Anoxychlamydiales bacterium]